MSLCFRCQHRVNFLEKKYRPRYECGTIETSVYSCYMFKPILPIELTKSDKSDKRPLFGPAMIASRCTQVKDSKVEYKLSAKVIDTRRKHESYVLYWTPKPIRKKSNGRKAVTTKK